MKIPVGIGSSIDLSIAGEDTLWLKQGDIFSLKGCAKFFNEVEFLGTACLSIFKISQCVTVHTKLARVEKRTKLEA